MNDFERLREELGKTENEFYGAFMFLDLIYSGESVAGAYRSIFGVDNYAARVNAGSYLRRPWVQKIKSLIDLDRAQELEFQTSSAKKVLAEVMNSTFSEPELRVNAAKAIVADASKHEEQQIETKKIDIFHQIAQIAKQGKMLSEKGEIIDVDTIDD